MSFDDMERQVDRFLTIWFPWLSVVVCAFSAVYFGAHVIAWALRGWSV